jgi:hypothetical protein
VSFEIRAAARVDPDVEALFAREALAAMQRLGDKGRLSAHEHDLRASVGARDFARQGFGSRVEGQELHAGLFEELRQAGRHHAARPRTPGERADDAPLAPSTALGGRDAAEHLVRHRVSGLTGVAEPAGDRREEDEKLEWVVAHGAEQVLQALDLRSEDELELFVGLGRERGVCKDSGAVDDSANRPPLGADRSDDGLHGGAVADVDRMVRHLGARPLERGHVRANLAAVEDELRLPGQLPGHRRRSRRSRVLE